jgi:glycosyltransferase involved in cell wall biosynthesis
MSNRDEPSRPIRLVIQQPSLARYRVPVFRELAGRPGIQLKVVYSTSLNLPNVEPEGFEAEHVPMWRRCIGREPVYWHSPQVRYATRRRADVLMMNWDVHYLSMVPGLLRARAAGVPTVLWGHGYSKQERPARRWLRQSVARLATALVFYNRGTAEAYVREGWDPRRVFVALNALDQGPIQAARADWLGRPGDLAAFRREQGLDGGGPVVLFVSRLDADNRVDLLLQAAARLVGRHGGLRVVIVGKGPDQPRLERMAGELGLRDRVRFTGAI